MIVKKYKIINRVAKYVRIKSNIRCKYCQRYAKETFYCVSTYYGGGIVGIICNKANFQLRVFGYVPELWYVIKN